MATGRFRGSDIQSLMPSIDARASSQTFVVDGRNFLWDSKGPKSGFGSLQLTPFPFSKGKDIHGIRIQNRAFVFTQDAILAWRNNSPYMWELMWTFDTDVPNQFRFPWQAEYLNGKLYLSHPARGILSANMEDPDNYGDQLWLHHETAETIPGLPPTVKGMAVVHGRMILVNDFLITWSATGDMTDLTPTLGGAGFQVIAGIVKGTYVGLTQFADGFIVWTTEGAVLAQFVGGDEVWRFDPFVSQERPINAWSTVDLTTGASAFLSRRGLFVSGAGENPEPWTPQFNEHFREYTKNKGELRYWHFRLTYDAHSQMIYLSESQNLISFTRTWALSATLDKWGVFSEETYGMMPMTMDRFGYTDMHLIPHYFADQFSREIEPSNELGLSRLYPRMEKRTRLPSSSLVGRAIEFNTKAPFESAAVARGAWYAPKVFIPFSPSLQGMDSWIEIGYLRPDEINTAADAYTEFQEITIGGIAVAAPTPVDFTTSWKADYFYLPEEDWNTDGVFTPGDSIEDLMVEDGEEDYLLGGLVPAEDWLNMDFPIFVIPPTDEEDWDEDGEAEDWNHPVSGLPALSYDLLIRSSQDGISVDEFVPQMSKFNSATSEFTTIASGTYHSLIVAAGGLGQWYHVRALDLTMTYGGEQT